MGILWGGGGVHTLAGDDEQEANVLTLTLSRKP